jgi:hypothetical protein
MSTGAFPSKCEIVLDGQEVVYKDRRHMSRNSVQLESSRMCWNDYNTGSEGRSVMTTYYQRRERIRSTGLGFARQIQAEYTRVIGRLRV